MTAFTEEVRETVSPHKFGGSRIAAACYLIDLDGCADETTGDAIDWQYHAARIGRRVLYTDPQGFVWVDTYDSELQAARAFEADDRSYGEYLEAQEEESQAWSDGFRPADSVVIDRFHPGEAVRVEGMPGIAFRVEGMPTLRLSSFEWSGIEYVNPARRLVHMVGDDRTFDYDCDILSSLDDDDYCSSCGQVGCGWC